MADVGPVTVMACVHPPLVEAVDAVTPVALSLANKSTVAERVTPVSQLVLEPFAKFCTPGLPVVYVYVPIKMTPASSQPLWHCASLPEAKLYCQTASPKVNL